ncbi:hypothetical protein HG536_0G04980 [Torulaspora globosa]|uniref:Epoxide hydrolase N-terminal domain-containing protein n=1 Tax=Torulaspora globosa TaxID=48254 RepID=A0A7G3ZEA9_9SACH|nr:uncharacterized protein HG536_0C00100 [Torulaspora globosa]XP_037141309.1 uncharacterized protein HG536_0G04980 [Torulaspora globosa]QLL31845.1 hypothetical protein HG536_0C00100 [Torulaspora globosa]QLL34635.1 hypothetical protein HG536_0G04980 [Torulaspora globosa]
MSVEPFSIHISDSELNELGRRTTDVRFPKNIENEKWDRGISGAYLSDVVEYWKTKYNWRKAEEGLNMFHHFKTTISNTSIHFIYEKGRASNSIPIILSHGWPDSFLRYIKMIPLLTDPEKLGIDSKFSFDVVIPSLPGFGFSDYPKSGLINNETISDLWLELMTKKLGYHRFVASGGDIGSGVTRYLASKYPENLIGIHLTDVGIIRQLIGNSVEQSLSSEEQNYVESISAWLKSEAGYMSIQATKPQTLAFGLSDSPVGLAAWILEKFHSWGGLKTDLSLDDILTNIMIYWFNNNISTATRIYYENSHSLNPIGTIGVPTAVCLFSEDILLPPREWVERNFNIVRWKVVRKGGHFTSMENPIAYAQDLFQFVEGLGKTL